MKLVRTSGDIDKVVSRGLLDFDVALTNVVLVTFERHVAVFSRDESDQRLSVPSALSAEAKCDASPIMMMMNVRSWHQIVTSRQHDFVRSDKN